MENNYRCSCQDCILWKKIESQSNKLLVYKEVVTEDFDYIGIEYKKDEKGNVLVSERELSFTSKEYQDNIKEHLIE